MTNVYTGITLANAKMLEFAVASSANAMRLMGSLHGSDGRKKSYDAQLGSPGSVPRRPTTCLVVMRL